MDSETCCRRDAKFDLWLAGTANVCMLRLNFNSLKRSRTAAGIHSEYTSKYFVCNDRIWALSPRGPLIYCGIPLASALTVDIENGDTSNTVGTV